MKAGIRRSRYDDSRLARGAPTKDGPQTREACDTTLFAEIARTHSLDVLRGLRRVGTAVSPKSRAPVMSIEDGWLIGFNAGEWGGSLVAADRSQGLETIADEDGRYEFTGLAAGDFAI